MTDCWWRDAANVNELAWWLIGNGRIESAQDCQNLHDSPWRWTLEWTDMRTARISESARRIFVDA